MRRAPTSAALVLSLIVAGLCLGAPAHAATKWLCSPAKAGDPCDVPGDTVALGANGAREDVPPRPVRRQVDCFYVYPTVSEQATPNAKRIAEPAVRSIATYQAARFNRQCRVFAPLYRQATLKALTSGGFTPESLDLAYSDVRVAFGDFLKRSRGRGFVLIGHSQGTGMLRRLVADEVDTKPAVRRRLVSALLLGGNVTVRKGALRGGDFANVPLCSKAGEAGCIIAYSTFLDDPPADALFGNVATARVLNGRPTKPNTEVACVNPASVGRNAIRPFTTISPSEPFGGPTIRAGITGLYGGELPTADATWVIPSDRYRGRCERINGAHVLKLSGVGGARHLTALPTPGWGLHLVDVNGALGELETAVAAQVKTYLKRD